MKINPNIFKVAPKKISKDATNTVEAQKFFNDKIEYSEEPLTLCVYLNKTEQGYMFEGKDFFSSELYDWLYLHNTESRLTWYIDVDNNYLNVVIYCAADYIYRMFHLDKDTIDIFDGFSPNLNKSLHIGHFSNFVIAKALQHINFSKFGASQTIAVYGDTQEGSITKTQALKELNSFLDEYNYRINRNFYASIYQKNTVLEESVDFHPYINFKDEVKNLLVPGTGNYENTLCVNTKSGPVVCLRNDGTTTYMFQDVCVLAHIKEIYETTKVLYLTGSEQKEHFENLFSVFPEGVDAKHLGLGHVKLIQKDGVTKKMSSREGNVVLISEYMDMILPLVNNDKKLAYNIFAGFILSKTIESEKRVSLDGLVNPAISKGLYLSYTMARLQSAGCSKNLGHKFNSLTVEYAYIKARYNLKPNILFDALYEHCVEINKLYATHRISDNEDNKKMFEQKLEDLIYGAKQLGMYRIDKV